MSLLIATVIAWSVAVAFASALPAAAENVVRFASSAGGAATMDPHSYLNRPTFVATKQVYEALVDISSNLAVVPQLATAWKPLNPTTWEFELRPGVTFQDGTPFTAADVVFSIERARAETSDIRTFLGGIATVEAIDDHTVHITTTDPDPSLWVKLVDVAIMSKAWAGQHGVTTPADYMNAHEETYTSRHANGTGPFMLEEFEPRGRWVMVRNPDWWGTADYPHNIDRIIHTLKDDAGNLAALLAGEIDLLQAPTFAAMDQIRRTPGLKVAQTTKLHTVYLAFDQGSPRLRSSDVEGRNPFQDKLVRQAIVQAVDLGAVLRPLMGDLYLPAGMMVAPGVNGYVPELDQPISYDPEKARALLAEAGYPDGFSVTLDCPSEWGDDETTTCRGVAEHLSTVGIEVAIDWLSSDELHAKVYKDRR